MNSSEEHKSEAQGQRDSNEHSKAAREKMPIVASQVLGKIRESIERCLRLAEGSQVVDVAIRLAELKGSREPAAFLDEATALLYEASFRLLEEPERQKRTTKEEIHRELVQNLQANRVPLHKIFRTEKHVGIFKPEEQISEFRVWLNNEPKEIQWKIYQSEEGFRKLVTKHYTTRFEQAASVLRSLLNKPVPDVDGAWNCLDTLRLPSTENHWKQLKAITDANNAEQFVRDWLQEVCETIPNEVLAITKKGYLDYATLAALWQTREESNRKGGGSTRAEDSDADESKP